MNRAELREHIAKTIMATRFALDDLELLAGQYRNTERGARLAHLEQVQRDVLSGLLGFEASVKAADGPPGQKEPLYDRVTVDRCLAFRGGQGECDAVRCALVAGHEGKHVAGTGAGMISTWAGP